MTAPVPEPLLLERATAPPGRRALFRPCVIDAYHVKLMFRPMAVALLITMGALLAERMLRLFDLIVDQGAALKPVMTIALSLTPHYLGLALPAAFCVGLMTTLMDLNRNNEIVALESAGWSLRRIGAAFVVTGVLLAMLSTLLFGFAQPYARYAYRAAKHAVVTAGWSGHVEQAAFLEVNDDIVLSAVEVDATGRGLSGVFILERSSGGDTVTTARYGVVVPDPAGRSLHLRLEDGVSLTASGPLAFDTLVLSRDFNPDGEPFRPRGATRELTLAELARQAGDAANPAEARELWAEFHARIVRSVSLLGIALAAIPLSVVGPRASAWSRIALMLGLLTAYHHVLLFAQALGADGTIDAATALWSAYAAFMAVALWLYIGGVSQGGRSAVGALLRWLEGIRPRARTEPS